MDTPGPLRDASVTASTAGQHASNGPYSVLLPSPSLRNRSGFFFGSHLESVLLDTTLHMFVSDRIPGEAPTATLLSPTCFFFFFRQNEFKKIKERSTRGVVCLDPSGTYMGCNRLP